MRWTFFPARYLWWHYQAAVVEFLVLARSLIKFVFDFFSVGILVRSYLSPWRRLHEEYEKRRPLGEWFEVFVLNMLMRAVGIFMRTIMIAVGLAATLISLLVAAAGLILWLAAPVLVVILFGAGLNLLLG